MSVAESSESREWRNHAAERCRRIIFNNDGGDLYATKTSSAQELLDLRTTPLIGTHVDSIFYCTRCSGFGLFTHRTKAGHAFTAKEDRFPEGQLQALFDAGTDPLQIMVDFGRQHGIEIFWSMRMNDTHDGTGEKYSRDVFEANPLKVAHPELLIGSPQSRPKYGAWSAVDYGQPEIRALAHEYIEEVCQNYDIDGVELDFFRHPVFFRSTAAGQRVNDSDVDNMTQLVTRIRATVDKIGRDRGRPILVAVRTPDSIDYCRAIGLDLELWMANGLIDLFIPSSYFQLNDWEYSTSLGRKYGVKVYPSLDESRVRDESARKSRNSVLAYRGRAANALAAGADGVYIFNKFDAHSRIWRELGDAKTLTHLDKDYFGSIHGVGRAAGGNFPHQSYQHCETISPNDPKTLPPGEQVESTIRIAEARDFQTSKVATVRLRFKAAPKPEEITVLLNDHPIFAERAGNQWLEFPNVQSLLLNGANTVNVSLIKRGRSPVLWSDVVVLVRDVN